MNRFEAHFKNGMRIGFLAENPKAANTKMKTTHPNKPFKLIQIGLNSAGSKHVQDGLDNHEKSVKESNTIKFKNRQGVEVSGEIVKTLTQRGVTYLGILVDGKICYKQKDKVTYVTSSKSNKHT